MGHLLKRNLGADTTLEMKIHYLTSARSRWVIREANFLEKGRKLLSLQSTACDEAGRKRRVCDDDLEVAVTSAPEDRSGAVRRATIWARSRSGDNPEILDGFVRSMLVGTRHQLRLSVK